MLGLRALLRCFWIPTGPVVVMLTHDYKRLDRCALSGSMVCCQYLCHPLYTYVIAVRRFRCSGLRTLVPAQQLPRKHQVDDVRGYRVSSSDSLLSAFRSSMSCVHPAGPCSWQCCSLSDQQVPELLLQDSSANPLAFYHDSMKDVS